MVALAVLAVLLVVFYLVRHRRKAKGDPVRDATPALEAFLRETLEAELASAVLGVRDPSAHERRRLTQTLAHEPDADVVAKIEELVRAVEIEFVKYAHEADVEATVHVRYEDGRIATARRRFARGDVPEAVKDDFAKKGASRVFRTWSFPWQAATAL